MAFSLAEAEHALSFASPVLAALLLVRMYMAGLIGRYRSFTLFLACLVAEELVAVGIHFPRASSHYLDLYITTESILWLAQILAVIEIFSMAVRGYEGIARSGKAFLWTAVVLAVVTSLGLTVLDRGTALAQFPALEQYLSITRIVATMVLVFLVLTLAFLFWFPVPLSRNAMSYAIGFSIYFTCRAVTRLFATFAGQESLFVLSTISLSVLVICLIFWTIFLSREGEKVDIVLGPRRAAADTRALLDRLESINSTLLGAGRR